MRSPRRPADGCCGSHQGTGPGAAVLHLGGVKQGLRPLSRTSAGSGRGGALGRAAEAGPRLSEPRLLHTRARRTGGRGPLHPRICDIQRGSCSKEVGEALGPPVTPLIILLCQGNVPTSSPSICSPLKRAKTNKQTNKNRASGTWGPVCLHPGLASSGTWITEQRPLPPSSHPCPVPRRRGPSHTVTEGARVRSGPWSTHSTNNTCAFWPRSLGVLGRSSSRASARVRRAATRGRRSPANRRPAGTPKRKILVSKQEAVTEKTQPWPGSQIHY